MALNTWPSEVPFYPRRQGYSETPQENRIEYQVSNGLPKRRRAGSSSGDEVSVAIPMTWEQSELFWTHYRETLKDGTRAFTATDPATQTERVFQWKDRPQRAADGARWVIAGTLIRMPA